MVAVVADKNETLDQLFEALRPKIGDILSIQHADGTLRQWRVIGVEPDGLGGYAIEGEELIHATPRSIDRRA